MGFSVAVSTPGDDPCACCDLCDCALCAAPNGGYYTQFTFTIPPLTPGIGCLSGCPAYEGSWTVKYRGGCTWTSDEEVNSDNNDQCVGFCVPQSTYVPMWTLTRISSGWELVGAFCTIHWVFVTDLDGDDATARAMCKDGGTLRVAPLDTSAMCFDTVGNTITITPGGTFVPCIAA